MAATLDGTTLRLSGYVGDYYYLDGFSAGDIVMLLAQVDADADIDVHLNSGGGDAMEGAAIHALLSGREGSVHIIVEGVAASAASLIAMAGETVTMSAGAVMMIHDPSGGTWGTVADHEKTIEALQAIATSYARVYAAKSGLAPDACRTLMKDEIWLTPEEAVEKGFADDTTEKVAAEAAAFDYRVYAKAPATLVAMAESNDWRLPEAPTHAAARAPKPKASKPARPAASAPQKEPPMTEQTSGGASPEMKAAIAAAVKADRDRRTAIMGLEEAKGRETLAAHLADTTDLTVDAIKATLSASEKKAAGQPSEAQYESARTEGAGPAGAGLGGDGPKKTAKGDLKVLAAAVDRTNKRR